MFGLTASPRKSSRASVVSKARSSGRGVRSGTGKLQTYELLQFVKRLRGHSRPFISILHHDLSGFSQLLLIQRAPPLRKTDIRLCLTYHC